MKLLNTNRIKEPLCHNQENSNQKRCFDKYTVIVEPSCPLGSEPQKHVILSIALFTLEWVLSKLTGALIFLN